MPLLRGKSYGHHGQSTMSLSCNQYEIVRHLFVKYIQFGEAELQGVAGGWIRGERGA